MDCSPPGSSVHGIFPGKSNWSGLPLPSLEQYIAAAAAKSLQFCLTLCDPIDGSPPGSPVPGILQARILERVAISFSNHFYLLYEKPSLFHFGFISKDSYPNTHCAFSYFSADL